MALEIATLKKSSSPAGPKVGKPTRQTFPVLGMTCAACAVSVKSMLKSTEGVSDAGVNYANQTAWAEFESSVSPETLQNAVRAIGYDLIIDTEDPQAIQEEAQQKQYRELKSRTLWSSLLAAPVVIISVVSNSLRLKAAKL